jgi:hypothetical protein
VEDDRGCGRRDCSRLKVLAELRGSVAVERREQKSSTSSTRFSCSFSARLGGEEEGAELHGAVRKSACREERGGGAREVVGRFLGLATSDFHFFLIRKSSFFAIWGTTSCFSRFACHTSTAVTRK